MWPAAWLRSGKRYGSAPRCPGFRPNLQALEDRCVPSTLKVININDSGPGSLRYEIAVAQSNDTIVFDFGNKKANSTPHTITLSSGELDIRKNLTIQGPGAGLLTVTTTSVLGDASDGPSRIFEVEGGVTNATLSGMTISKGDGAARYVTFGNGDYYDGEGGGILNLGTLTVSGCTLSGNRSAGAGGGIANFGTLTVSGCYLSNNQTISGGGIYNEGTATVSNSTVSGNIAFEGGGIYNQGYAAALTVLDSIFSSNIPDNIHGLYTDGGGNTFH